MTRHAGLPSLLVGALCLPAAAVEGPEAGADPALNLSGDTAWRLELQPYAWAPARIDGNSTVAGTTVDLDLTLSDIFDAVDSLFVLSGRIEAWKGEWGIVFDGFYTSLEFDADVDPFGLPPVEEASVEIAQSINDLAVGWRIVDRPLEADDPWPRLRIDLFGGGRYQYLKQEITLSTGPDPGTSKDWMEIMVGGRAALQLSEKLVLGVRGDASGFGIGSASDLTWNLYGGVDIIFSPTFDMKVGYRVLDIDYDVGSGMSEFGMDVTMHGPYIGAGFRF